MAEPVLWHIAISHYNEKARWALDYKGVDHDRREPMPGAHMLVALALTRGRAKTFPILQLDGRFCAPFRERRGYRWVEEMFRHHRKRDAVVVSERRRRQPRRSPRSRPGR